MISIFSQKYYSDGRELVYDCLIDDNDLIHFIHGISNGLSSIPNQSLVNEIFSEIVIDFPKFRETINRLNFEKYNDNLIDEGDKVRIINMKGELLISKRFLNESFNILEKMWVDDEETKIS